MFVYWYIIVFICPEHTIVTYKYTDSFIPLNKGTSFFVTFEILKILHFHLNKISPLFWTLEPDVLWYLISFYKM